ncbi:MAG: response regulator [Planctomycetota bacterium]|jgi:DNA-binding response OmpR family regulator
MPFSAIRKIFSKESKSSKKRNVLIISDDKGATSHLSMFLEHMGYEVKTANSMLAATKILDKKIKFTALFVSAKLNSASGMTQVKELRADRRYAKIPVIFLCEKVRDNDNSALKENFPKSALLSTPFTTKNISRSLQVALEVGEDKKVKS